MPDLNDFDGEKGVSVTITQNKAGEINLTRDNIDLYQTYTLLSIVLTKLMDALCTEEIDDAEEGSSNLDNLMS